MTFNTVPSGLQRYGGTSHEGHGFTAGTQRVFFVEQGSSGHQIVDCLVHMGVSKNKGVSPKMDGL